MLSTQFDQFELNRRVLNRCDAHRRVRLAAWVSRRAGTFRARGCRSPGEGRWRKKAPPAPGYRFCRERGARLSPGRAGRDASAA